MFKGIITLNKNNRGCYILDTVKGCSYVNKEAGGCYGDCYANNIASRYGMDFGQPVKRCFESREPLQMFFDGFSDVAHESEIIKAIKKIEMPFVRIGEMGDPSEDWEHTARVCKIISQAEKPIVIITKHWKCAPDSVKNILSECNVCINTSVSALDTTEQIEHRLRQYFYFKRFCKSVLRIVSCEFNTDNEEGERLNTIQNYLFRIGGNDIIETVFRPSKKNKLVQEGVIKTEKVQFLGSKVLASLRDKNQFMGYCSECPDMCGVTK
jgi:hypothetical protein